MEVPSKLSETLGQTLGTLGSYLLGLPTQNTR
jgi:hypothetical protein